MLFRSEIGVPAFAFASSVGVQRMQVKAHHLSDVLSGALLGILVWKGFGAIHNEEENFSQKFSFTPILSSKYNALRFRIEL